MTKKNKAGIKKVKKSAGKKSTIGAKKRLTKVVKNKKRMPEDASAALFDSKSGNIDNLFSAGSDSAYGMEISLADIGSLEKDLEHINGVKFCGFATSYENGLEVLDTDKELPEPEKILELNGGLSFSANEKLISESKNNFLDKIFKKVKRFLNSLFLIQNKHNKR